MKILHLADVHFHESTLDDLHAPCERILEIARNNSNELDAAVIAGDLTTERGMIDNATAVKARSFVSRLSKYAHVYVLAGNHDLTYRQGQPNNLRAILADSLGSVLAGVTIVDKSEIVERDEYTLSFLPYPSAATFHALTGESDASVIASRLTDVARGLAAKAMEYGKLPLAVFHGSLEGGRMGDESSASLKTRGRDPLLPVAALADFAATLCGHLHHPQTIQTPGGIAVYPGCVTPLTYGERTIQPGVHMWEVSGDQLRNERIPLPVSHQRLQVEVGPHDWDEASDASINLRQWIGEAALVGARLKVKVTLGRNRLELLTPDLVESVRAELGLDQLKLDKTDLPSDGFVLAEGVDRAARVDMIEALATYADHASDPAYGENLEGILDIGREVEEIVQQEDADPRYECDPLHIELVNYKQFADVSLDISGLADRAGILGPTGIGKSNLILAIAAALYGGNPKAEVGQAKTSLGEMVRRGESSARVQLVFVARGKTYRVTRDVSVDCKGRGTSQLFLELSDGEDWLPLNAGTSRETQRVLESIVGPESLHWTTRHLRQHGTSAVKMGSADLADTINSTLQLNFQTRQDHAKQMVGTATAARDTAINRREALEGQVVPLEKIEQQEQYARQQKGEAEKTGTEAQQRADALEGEVQDAQQKHAEAKARLDTVAEAHLRRIDVDRKLAEARQQRQTVADRLGHEEGPASLDSLEAAASEARDLATAAADRLQELRDEDHQLALEESEALGGLQQSAQAAALRRTEANQREQGAKRRVDELGRSAAKLAEVPCRGERWLDPAEGEMDGSVCPLLVDAKLAKDGLADASDALTLASETYKGADEDARVALLKYQEYKEATEAERERRRANVRAASEAVVRSKELADRAQQNLTDARARAHAHRELTTQLAQLDERIAMLTEQARELNEQTAAVDDLRAAVQHAHQHLTEVTARLRSAREEAQRCRERLVRAEADLEQLHAERMQRDQMLSAIGQMRDEAKRQERRRLCASYYLEAVQRSGIPSLLLQQLAPQLEARVNDLLACAGRRIRIDTSRETTTGKVRTEVNLHFQSPTSRGAWVPIAELSGGEEDLANAAWAVGLARVSSDMTATPLGLLVLDEPFTGVSAEYEEAIREVLGGIHDHVRRVLVITHRRDLMPLFDSSVLLSQNGQGTAVEVIS